MPVKDKSWAGAGGDLTWIGQPGGDNGAPQAAGQLQSWGRSRGSAGIPSRAGGVGSAGTSGGRSGGGHSIWRRALRTPAGEGALARLQGARARWSRVGGAAGSRSDQSSRRSWGPRQRRWLGFQMYCGQQGPATWPNQNPYSGHSTFLQDVGTWCRGCHALALEYICRSANLEPRGQWGATRCSLAESKDSDWLQGRQPPGEEC